MNAPGQSMPADHLSMLPGPANRPPACARSSTVTASVEAGSAALAVRAEASSKIADLAEPWPSPEELLRAMASHDSTRSVGDCADSLAVNGPGRIRPSAYSCPASSPTRRRKHKGAVPDPYRPPEPQLFVS